MNQNEKKTEKVKSKRRGSFPILDKKEGEVYHLAFGIIHQLRNPIGIIRGMAQHCLEEGQLGEKERVAIEVILRSSDNMIEKIEQLAAFTAPMILSRKLESLENVIAKVIELVKDKCDKAKIEIETHFPTSIPKLSLDSEKMKLAILNVAVNAIEAMTKGGKIGFQIAENHEDKNVVVTVIDNGVGIAPEHIEDISRPFFTTKAGGMGLGLALSRKIMEGHGGEIKIETVPNQQTKVHLIIPKET